MGKAAIYLECGWIAMSQKNIHVDNSYSLINLYCLVATRLISTFKIGTPNRFYLIKNYLLQINWLHFSFNPKYHLMKAFYFAIIILIASCAQEKAYNYKNYIVDSVSFPTNFTKKISSLKDIRVAIAAVDESIPKLLVLFEKSRKLNAYNLSTGKLLMQMKIPETREQLIYKFALFSSSVLMSFPGRIEIVKDSQVLKEYYCEQKIDEHFYVYAIGYSGDLKLPNSNSFLLTLASHGFEADDEASWLKRFYSQPSMGLFSIVGDSLHITDTVSYFPASFQQKYHHSHGPLTAISG
ncbi:MAG: hypothetical protein ABI378_13675, partial [Chitinophagaceae bacterium]